MFPSRLADPTIAELRQGGPWYLADTGHAVYGPRPGHQRSPFGKRQVATYCQALTGPATLAGSSAFAANPPTMLPSKYSQECSYSEGA